MINQSVNWDVLIPLLNNKPVHTSIQQRLISHYPHSLYSKFCQYKRVHSLTGGSLTTLRFKPKRSEPCLLSVFGEEGASWRWSDRRSVRWRGCGAGGEGAGGGSAARTSRTRRPAAPYTIWSQPSLARTARRTSYFLVADLPLPVSEREPITSQYLCCFLCNCVKFSVFRRKFS